MIPRTLLTLSVLVCLCGPAQAQGATSSPPLIQSSPRAIPHAAEVREIIEAAVALPPASRLDRRNGVLAQQALFDRLIALGPDAVPAIIEQMDDPRPLPTPQISLVNHPPDAFEAIRHYGPRVMTDALAAILNQITGQDFGFIYNGATPEERTEAVSGWRGYLDRLRAGGEA